MFFFINHFVFFLLSAGAMLGMEGYCCRLFPTNPLSSNRPGPQAVQHEAQLQLQTLIVYETTPEGGAVDMFSDNCESDWQIATMESTVAPTQSPQREQQSAGGAIARQTSGHLGMYASAAVRQPTASPGLSPAQPPSATWDFMVSTRPSPPDLPPDGPSITSSLSKTLAFKEEIEPAEVHTDDEGSTEMDTEIAGQETGTSSSGESSFPESFLGLVAATEAVQERSAAVAAVAEGVGEPAVEEAKEPEEPPAKRKWRRRVAELQGAWHLRADTTVVHVIEGEEIRGPEGLLVKLQLDLDCDGSFTVDHQGQLIHAKVEGALVVWDDGDVWIHEESLKAFNGLWTHQYDPDLREFILGDTIHGPDGTQIQMTSRSRTSMSIVLNGQAHHAELKDDQLRWDDGDVWIRVPLDEAMDGRWRRSSGARHHIIVGHHIYNPDGSQRRILELHADHLVAEAADSSRPPITATFFGDRIDWGSGNVWYRDEAADGGDFEASDQAVWIAEVRRLSNDREHTLRELSRARREAEAS